MSDGVNDYRRIIYQTALGLSRDEAQDIALLYDLEHVYHEARQFIVLVQLEQKQIISENSPEKLVEVFKSINRADLANKAEKMSSSLRKTRKKKNRGKQTADGGVLESQDKRLPDDWFLIAKMQVEQLAFTLNKLRSSGDSSADREITAASEKLRIVNKHLARAERRRGLPTTKNQHITSCHFSDDDSSLSSCHSSLTSAEAMMGLQQPDQGMLTVHL